MSVTKPLRSVLRAGLYLIFGSIVYAGAFFFYWAIVYEDSLRTLESNQRWLSWAEGEIEKLHVTVPRLGELRHHRSQRVATLSALTRVFPSEPRTEELLVKIRESAAERGLQVTEAFFEEGERRGRLEETFVNLKLKGSNQGFAAFFREVVRFSRVVDVREVELRREGDVFHGNVELVTYWHRPRSVPKLDPLASTQTSS